MMTPISSSRSALYRIARCVWWGLWMFFFGFGNASVFAQTWEKIIDDGDPGYSETGNAWVTWTHPSGYNGSYRYLSHGGKNIPRVGTATWQVVVPHTGQYEISVYFRATANRTPDADYYVHDGNGTRHHVSLNQQTLPTGWHKLGTFAYTKGQTSRVVLDGTDDNESDEADAARWKFVSSQPPPPPPPPPPDGCETEKPGSYIMVRYAEQVQGKGDWANATLAQGSPDQKEASSPNVDVGDELLAQTFRFCTPKGSYTIQRVRVGVLGRMQYDNGPYQLVLFFESLGKQFTFSQTQRLWVWGDITAGKSAWTLADLQALTIRLGLHKHPGGKRDSIAPAACPAGSLRCGDSCVDAQQSVQHCGSCHRVCPANTACVAGNCASTCAMGLYVCQQICVDLQTHLDHCGKCNVACQEGENCKNGQCVPECGVGETLCGQQCAALSSHPSHCGACSKGCTAEQRCIQGVCTAITACPAPQMMCDGTCVSLVSNPLHCGRCGQMCGQDVECQQGQCIPVEIDPSQETGTTELPTSGQEPKLEEFPTSESPQASDGGDDDLRSLTRMRTGCVCEGSDSADTMRIIMVLLLLLLIARSPIARKDSQ